jgi:ATP-dependent RNA helicase HelY
VRIPEDYSRDKLDRIFDEIVLEDLRPVGDAPSEAFPEDDESCRLKERIASLPCEECPHKDICHAEKKNRILRIVEEFKSVIARMEGSGSWLWYSFKRHLRFLKETDFADEHGTLTVDGRWASNLRLDQPLLIAEAIRKGAFENIPPENLAGGLAPFVWDRGQDVEIVAGEQDLRPMEDTFGVIQGKIIEIRELKSNRGFQGPPVLYWPAAAVYLWAKGMSWEELIVTVHVSEGDMASLIMRTADHLRQIAALKDTHPEISAVASKGIESIMREPVYIP